MYPALAVVGALGERADVLWVGGRGGMEERLVRREGLPFKAIPAAGLHGVGLSALPRNLLQLVRGTVAARGVLNEYRPDVLFFTGGYVGGPVAVAGRGIPKVTFVPDVEPALALRWISRVADRVCVTTEVSRRYYRRAGKVRVTGYPSRFEGERPDKESARRELGLGTELPVVLVLGGSRGARSINLALWDDLEPLLERAWVVHLTGQRDWPDVEPVRARLSSDLADHYRPHAYLHEKMGHALAASDLVVSRAGASVLGEYPLFGLPSILVPYPHAWRYQRTNATYLAERGAAIVLEDQILGRELVSSVITLLNDRPRRAEMARAAARLAQEGAAKAVAEELQRVGGKASL